MVAFVEYSDYDSDFEISFAPYKVDFIQVRHWAYTQMISVRVVHWRQIRMAVGHVAADALEDVDFHPSDFSTCLYHSAR